MEDEAPPVPSLPSYLTTRHFMDKKQSAPLNKILSRMLKPRMRRMIKSPLKKSKNKHKIQFY